MDVDLEHFFGSLGRYYIPDALGYPVEVPWLRWSEAVGRGEQVLATTWIGAVHISTILFGFHREDCETMVFKGRTQDRRWTGMTRDEALALHWGLVIQYIENG